MMVSVPLLASKRSLSAATAYWIRKRPAAVVVNVYRRCIHHQPPLSVYNNHSSIATTSEQYLASPSSMLSWKDETDDDNYDNWTRTKERYHESYYEGNHDDYDKDSSHNGIYGGGVVDDEELDTNDEEEDEDGVHMWSKHSAAEEMVNIMDNSYYFASYVSGVDKEEEKHDEP